MTREEITAKYKELHDNLGKAYYQRHELNKEDFDTQHRQIWADLENELIAEGYKQLPQPPLSTHISTLVSIDVGRTRPAKVKRVWEGRDYFYDCFVTESIKDQYVNGDIQVGDHLLVFFEMGEQIVTNKVYKSW